MPHFGQFILTSPISLFVSYPHPFSTLHIIQFILFLLLPPRQCFVIDQLCQLPLRTESPRLSLISSLEDFPFYSAHLFHILEIVTTVKTILATLQTISSKFFAPSDRRVTTFTIRFYDWGFSEPSTKSHKRAPVSPSAVRTVRIAWILDTSGFLNYHSHHVQGWPFLCSMYYHRTVVRGF
jgi:hypothetical protein